MAARGPARPGSRRRARTRPAAAVRDALLAILAHALRSPLNGIQSWSQVLEQQLPRRTPMMDRALAGIRTGVDQQVRLIEDLLEAARRPGLWP